LQGNNKQSNRLITHEGRCQTIAQWAREIGMSRQSLRHRLENGWSIKEALTMKLNYGNGWERGVRA
jgi:response regulator of citrate/malate metabolism